jgi:hypothetical protein
MSTIPIAFRPEYQHFVEKNIKRKLVISFSDGENISLDLNKLPKHDSFRDIPVENMAKIVTIRWMVGRDVLTLSRKDPKTGKYTEGFFHHGMARTAMGDYHSMIEYEILGFCYNANGDSINFKYDYTDIIRKLYRRNERLQELNELAEEAEDENNITKMVKIEDDIDKLLNSPLDFVIDRKEENFNLLETGYAIHLFYEMDDEETKEFVNQSFKNEKNEEVAERCNYAKYRKYVVELRDYNKSLKYRKDNKLNTKDLKKPATVERPFIPRLPYQGIPPKMTFRTKESGQI